MNKVQYQYILTDMVVKGGGINEGFCEGWSKAYLELSDLVKNRYHDTFQHMLDAKHILAAGRPVPAARRLSLWK